MLNQEENQQILQEEMESLKNDILAIYNRSGKRTTGEFERGLEVEYNSNSATLKGYEYLGGRRPGKQPPIQAIENWINTKGINPIEANMKVSSLAFLIARKIAKEGTRKESNLAIYSQVVTPERIDKILERINQLNANAFIQEVVGTITKAFNEHQ
jgi:hypothetical protein